MGSDWAAGMTNFVFHLDFTGGSFVLVVRNLYPNFVIDCKNTCCTDSGIYQLNDLRSLR